MFTGDDLFDLWSDIRLWLYVSIVLFVCYFFIRKAMVGKIEDRRGDRFKIRRKSEED